MREIIEVPSPSPDNPEAARTALVKQLQKDQSMDTLWTALVAFAGHPFSTAKGLEFTYRVKGYEIFVDRKEKSITRSSVELAYRRALELEGNVTGPKKLGIFGASYLYPVFIRLGIIKGLSE